MYHKSRNSNFIDLKIKLWIGLLTESILLSVCGSEISEQKPEERPVIQTEEPGIITEEIVAAEQNDRSSSGDFLTHSEGEYDEYGDQYSRIETEEGDFEVTLYDKEEAVVNRFAIVMIMIILLCSGCGNGNAGEDTAGELQITEETQQVESAQQEAFVEPEKNHKVPAYDICALPKYDYENTPLAEYIEADIAWNEEMAEKMGKQFPLEIDYHLFDFNDDGIEDYLLCRKGRLFDGREGNSVEIFIQEEDGVRCVLSRVMWLHNDSGHDKLAVLDEKTDGYFAIVPPHGGRTPEDIILKYNAKTEQYEGEEGGRDYCMMPEDSDFVNFKDLDRNHKILAYDVCSSPKYDYENTPLAEYIEETFVADVEERSEIEGRELTCDIDYHLFDFNDDGIEDYLLCVSASGWGGSVGNHVEIYIREEGGVRCVLDITARLHVSLSEHEMFTVLDEKTNGYRAIAFEESHYILRYDAEAERYRFGVRE